MNGRSFNASDSNWLSDSDDLFDDTDLDIDLINDLVATTSDMTTEELLVSINDNLTQINLFTGFTVTVGFALVIVYITIKPVFWFFD